MKRFFTLLLLAGAISATQAQKLEKTALEIPNLKKSYNIDGFGSDANNYYVCGEALTRKGFTRSYFVVNKNLTTVKEYPIVNEDSRFLRILTTESDVVILLARYKKSEQKTYIIKQTYAKSTGKFKNETVIASFETEKSDSWAVLRTSVSPDKTKTAFLFMIANKKSTVDSYYAAVFDEGCNIEWDSENELGLSNEVFNVQNFIVTNKGELYIAFSSKPENIKKATDKNLYIDLVYLLDDTKEKMTLPIEKHQFGKVQLKPLKNGDIYLASLFAKDENSYQTELLSMILNGKKFNDNKSHTKEIEEKNTHVRQPRWFPTGSYLWSLGIEKILELDNGNIAIVCEQETSVTINWDGAHFYCEARGSVSTFFVNGNDASVENVSVMEKLQSIRTGGIYFTPQSAGLSIFPFVYGNKVGYFFNDALEKYTAPAKYKGDFMTIKNFYGKGTAIVLSTQENDKTAKIELLSGNVEAGRLVREILFEEDNRLVILTQSKKTTYIETLSLP